MKNFPWKRVVPHLIAIGVFLLVTFIFCRPALEPGKTLNMYDMQLVKGMQQNLTNHVEKDGTSPLWLSSMFGGMPAFVLGVPAPTHLTEWVHKIMTLNLPEPFQYFFLCCICFYIFCMCIGVRPYLAIGGALAFAFASYVPIIISAGHITKVWALAYSPALLGGALMVYNKKYLWGFLLTALFTMQEIGRNHQQISYYTFLIMGIATIAYIVKWVKEKDLKHAFKAIALVAIAGTLGVLTNAVNLFTTYDYAKHSKRGGQLILPERNKETADSKTTKEGFTKGLSREYAYQWSYGKLETFTLMFPGVMGYGARGGELNENSHIAKVLEEKANYPSDQAGDFAKSFSGALYWGDQPFTDGTVYLGAVVCFLFIFGLVYVKSIHKWWILGASILAIILSWGHNFPAFNNFAFDYFPFYNKFRAPTMILVIPQLLFPVLGVMAVQQLLDSTESKAELFKQWKVTCIATGAVFALALFMYMSLDFKNENTQRTAEFNKIISSNSPTAQQQLQALNEKYPAQTDNRMYENLVYQSKGNTEMAQAIVKALHQDRAATFGKDIMRSLLFILPVALLMGLFIQQRISANILLAAIGICIITDLFSIDQRYLGEDSYVDADQLSNQNFSKSEADATILEDKEPDFRVLNLASGKDPYQESLTSYYHNSIGGYSPAKIGAYDDLITYQLAGQPNVQVINMLNTKYVIQNNPQTNKPVAQLNPGRLGNAWIVKAVKFVDGPANEMRALDHFDAKDTAIVQDTYKSLIPQNLTYDSTATIKLVKFDNDSLSYETNATTPQVAVLSEIYYEAGWNMYIDGKKTDYFKTNYVLRGMVVPQGKHTVEFKFEPLSHKYSYAVAKFSNIIIVLVFLGIVGSAIVKKRKATA
ncbi:membrane protein YfhO [Filimonas lacunae]|uniref:Membrane protein YfhO n=1 Tax=Filimonas lacunae TaxID=477680 RepID=A0A173MI90_9BACT|nr:YfhO family protein [Filimonas lacunae]BAV07187.1 hypothetical protein FLA_3210 [Filimonas lacunae]SIS93582.1 membrane protein YfhO [Filimonas lacunae]